MMLVQQQGPEALGAPTWETRAASMDASTEAPCAMVIAVVGFRAKAEDLMEARE